MWGEKRKTRYKSSNCFKINEIGVELRSNALSRHQNSRGIAARATLTWRKRGLNEL